MENNMSQKGYNQMMQLLKDFLPEDNIVLDNYYQTKKYLGTLKRMIGNKASVEGSICEAYLMT
ncbi:hypothetical protein KY290_034092 [Solanum tuberosum]|uniref:Uncharacterized protein n=1 Tax=Solanum tuberosum TaxID=4113 RepID=A0ABQ7U469_SOLTU|nr:hypothetical protein KY289_033485 [Solanum tuberosum]KAH0741049.1 hypothetical protein KY290_034092 [Solanum tuberosum]